MVMKNSKFTCHTNNFYFYSSEGRHIYEEKHINNGQFEFPVWYRRETSNRAERCETLSSICFIISWNITSIKFSYCTMCCISTRNLISNLLIFFQVLSWMEKFENLMSQKVHFKSTHRVRRRRIYKVAVSFWIYSWRE